MIYLVTGYPRSGTSMLCKCLDAGGLNVVKTPWLTDALSNRAANGYNPHPSGVYEVPYRQDVCRADWPKMYDGMALKVVFPYVHCLAVHEYKAVAIFRDPTEIQRSFSAAMNGLTTLDEISGVTEKAMQLLRSREDVELSTLNYRDVIENPRESLAAALSGWPIDIDKAASAVDPSLYRFQA